MLIRVLPIFALVLALKITQSVSAGDVPLLGTEIKPPFPSVCKMYETGFYNLNILACLSTFYRVQLIDMPKKDFTHKTYCPPSPQFAVFYYNLIPRKGKDGRFNVTLCMQKNMSFSTTYKLYCKEVMVVEISCEDIYLDNEELDDIGFEMPSRVTVPETTPTQSPTTTELPTSAEAVKCRKYYEINEDCHDTWMCRFYQLLTLLIAVVASGAIGTYLYCKFKDERNEKLKSQEAYKRLIDQRGTGNTGYIEQQ